MTLDKILEPIKTITSHVTFTYNGQFCGIDPLAGNDFDMWYGDNEYNAKSIEEVISVKLFNGKNLQQIAGDIKTIN